MRRPLLIPLLALTWTLPAIGLDDPTITVGGSAKISVRPDQVVLTASIESRNTQLAAAKEDNDKKIAAAIGFLESSKIAPKDIQTDFIEIDPVYPRAAKGYSSLPQKTQPDADPLKPTGYTVRRGFKIRIRDIKSFEKIYTGLIQRGINRVDGILFQSSEQAKLESDARQTAIANAKTKAELLVSQLGAKLSGVQSIEESLGDPFVTSITPVVGDPFGDTSPPPLAAGEIQITADVSVVFRMSETDFD